MNPLKHLIRSFLFSIFLLLACILYAPLSVYAQFCGDGTACDVTTPCFDINLSSNADSLVDQKFVPRLDYCCAASGTDRCIRFIVTLHPSVSGIYFGARSPGPSGSMYFVFDCDPLKTFEVNKDTACVDGPGPHSVSICKPGGDNPIYTIAGIGAGEISDPIVVSDGCLDTLYATGFKEASLTWTSIPYNAVYNSYLSDTVGEDTVIVMPTGIYPDSIQYKVCGQVSGLNCAAVTDKCDSTWVYFVKTLAVTITPTDAAICPGASDITLTANPTGGGAPYTYLWSTGSTASSITVTTAGAYSVEVTDTTGCPSAMDTVNVIKITDPITADAGTDDTICSTSPSIALNGTVTGVTTGRWSGGTGTFSPNDSTIDPLYVFSAADISAGSVTLQLLTTNTAMCTPDSDIVVITIESPPTVFAGLDDIVCADTAGVSLSGTVGGGATGGIWSSSGGGSFTPSAASLTATYLLSATDITNGTANLILTTTGTFNCPPQADTMKVTITPAPTVNAGPDDTVCANIGSAALMGSVTVASGGEWSTLGSGAFSPSINNLGATYTFSPGDISAGSATIVLKTIGNGDCKTKFDTMRIVITPIPTVNAGADDTVCADIGSYQLMGSVTVAAGGIWSTPGTGTFDNPNLLNATYTPSAADKSAGSVTFTLTTTGNGGCTPVSDAMKLVITPAPTANAGSDVTICNDQSSIAIMGSVTVATGGIWSTTGNGGFSPSNTSLTATYTFGSTDISMGGATIALTTTGNGDCNAVTDLMTLTLTPKPTVNAGKDTTVCSTANAIQLDGTITVATGGTWTSSGSGTFSPSSTTIDAIYNPSAADKAGGSFLLILTTTGNGTCNAYKDTAVLTIQPAPASYAGNDTTVCSNFSDILLDGKITGASGGTWTASSVPVTSNFSPNNTTLNATYSFKANDYMNGSVFLILASTGNGVCPAAIDSMKVTIPPGPTVDAGTIPFACATDGDVLLDNASFTNAGGVIWSSPTGGSFSPGATSLVTTYTFSAADLASMTGGVTLTLTTTGTAPCPAVSDTIFVEIRPVIDAGQDTIVCSDADTVQLNGVAFNFVGNPKWTIIQGTGSFTPNDSILNPAYILTPADIAGGLVSLKLAMAAFGCPKSSDTVNIFILAPPSADAGSDTTVCITGGGVLLTGTVTNASGGLWTTSAGGIFSPSPDSLQTTYSSAASGTDTLVLSTTGSCTVARDTLLFTTFPQDTVDAGFDEVMCNTDTGFQLNGSINNISSGVYWTTTGTGYFLPDSNALTGTYIRSSADSIAGIFSLILHSDINACTQDHDTVEVTILPAPTADAGTDITICFNTPTPVALSPSATNYISLFWTINGGGSLIPDNTSLIVSYQPDTSVSMQDTLILTVIGTCTTINDWMVFSVTPSGSVDAGTDTSICVGDTSVQLSGTITNISKAKWTTNGTGSFSPDDSTLNALYLISSADSLAGSVILILSGDTSNCNAPVDSITLLILPPPVITTGNDTSICFDTAGIALYGVAINSPGILWTTTASGTFSPSPDSLNAVYFPAASGTDTIILSSVGSCLFDSDTMVLSLTVAGVVIAGTDQSVCFGDTTVLLSGVLINTATGYWTTRGTGYFIPDSSFLDTITYIISDDDSIAGFVWLVLTGDTTDCNIPVDSMKVSILPPPVIDAGADDTVCANNGNVLLSPVYDTVAVPGILWVSSGNGTFIPDSITPNATYAPGTSDISAGIATLTIYTVGSCFNVQDSLKIVITPAPTANAGSDAFVCRTNPLVTLSGVVTVATGGEWSTTGSGSFADSSDLGTTYTPSDADTTDGFVFIILTTTGNGLCLPVNDTMKATFTPDQITVDAGASKTVCASVDSILLSGTVFIATGGLWTTTGNGVFSPSDSVLTTYYKPDTSDLVKDSVQFYLTTTGNGGCIARIDSVAIRFQDSVVVTATTPDDTVCANQLVIQLNGTVLNATGVKWTALAPAGGIFLPNNTALNPKYQISQVTDLVFGYVTFVITSTGNGFCTPVADTVRVVILPAPVAGFTFTEECFGNPVAFTDTSQPTGDIVKWNWNFGDGIDSVNQNPSHIFTADGYKTVTLIVTSSNGCPDTAIVDSILVHPLPQIGFLTTAECLVDSAYFTDTSTITIDSLISWNWTFGDGGKDSVRNPSHLYPSEGLYTVTLSVTSSFGCVDSVSQTFNVSPGPIPDFTFSKTCFPDSIAFRDTSTISNVFAPHWIVSWNWDFGDGTKDTVQNPPAHLYGSAGSYPVKLVVVSEKGCTDSVTIQVPLNPKPDADFIFNNVCEVDSIFFKDTSLVSLPDTIVKWSWYFGDGKSDSVQNTAHLYNTFGSYLVELIVETDNGCLDTVRKVAGIMPSPGADFSVNSNLFSTEDKVYFTDNSTGSSAIPDTVALINWNWDFYYPANGTGDSSSSSQNPFYLYPDTGYYVIQLVVQNEFLCRDTVYDTLRVFLNPLVPSGFTPDGSGENDVLYVEGGPYSQLEFVIYNEWGEVLFRSNRQEDGWNGTKNGVNQPMGVYVYTVIATTVDGNKHQLWGNVTLMR